VERAIVNVHAHADHLETHLKGRTSGPQIIISDERDALFSSWRAAIWPWGMTVRGTLNLYQT